MTQQYDSKFLHKLWEEMRKIEQDCELDVNGEPTICSHMVGIICCKNYRNLYRDLTKKSISSYIEKPKYKQHRSYEFTSELRICNLRIILPYDNDDVVGYFNGELHKLFELGMFIWLVTEKVQKDIDQGNIIYVD